MNKADTTVLEPAAPEGFELLPGCEQGFLQLIGPLYVNQQGRAPNHTPVIGLYLDERHLNYSRGAHGGLLATIADMQGAAVRAMANLGDAATPTVSLSIEFIAPAPSGAWLELHSYVTGKTKTMLFSRAELIHGDRVIAHTTGIYKIGRIRDIDVELHPLSVTGY